MLARVALGGVFLVSGALKSSDRDRWRRQARDLVVPDPVASMLPWAEVALGAVLVAGVAAPWPAIVAAVVLLAFSIFIARRLRDGARPACACFGAHSDRPLGVRHLIRNAGFVALAAVAALAGQDI